MCDQWRRMILWERANRVQRGQADLSRRLKHQEYEYDCGRGTEGANLLCTRSWEHCKSPHRSLLEASVAWRFSYIPIILSGIDGHLKFFGGGRGPPQPFPRSATVCDKLLPVEALHRSAYHHRTTRFMMCFLWYQVLAVYLPRHQHALASASVSLSTTSSRKQQTSKDAQNMCSLIARQLQNYLTD